MNTSHAQPVPQMPYNCPQCRSVVSVPASAMGAAFACPRCSVPFVPTPPQAQPLQAVPVAPLQFTPQPLAPENPLEFDDSPTRRRKNEYSVRHGIDVRRPTRTGLGLGFGAGFGWTLGVFLAGMMILGLLGLMAKLLLVK